MNQIIKPPRLKPGDTIAIISPASPLLPAPTAGTLEFLKSGVL